MLTIHLGRDFDDLSFAEIAGRLGVAEDAARMRHRRALPKLARTLRRLRAGDLAERLWIRRNRARDEAGYRRALTMRSPATRVAASPLLLPHLQWAACAGGAGDVVDKRESAESLLRSWPDQPVALHHAAANLQDLDPGRAADLQRHALELGLDDINGLRNLGAYLYEAGRSPEWVAPLRQHLEAHPDDALREAFLGMLEDAGLLDILDAEAGRWIEEAPDSPLAQLWAGRARVERDDAVGAQPLFRRVVELLPDDADAHYDLALVTDTEADREESIRELHRVLELAPDHERAHRRLLAVLGGRGDSAGVTAELARWVAARPDDRDGWMQLAAAAVESGDPALRITALVAIDRADILSDGVDAVVLERKAALLDQLDCPPAAAACRERIGSLRR